MNTNKLVILVVETRKASNTDYVYVKATLSRFYNLEKVSLKPIYMKGKGNYQNVKTEIDVLKLGAAESYVVYCIDYDKADVDYAVNEQNENIKKYCKANNYLLVFFNRDVEEVYLGKSVSASKKVLEATKFNAKKQIKNVDEKCLSNVQYCRYKSNILCELDKILNRI